MPSVLVRLLVECESRQRTCALPPLCCKACRDWSIGTAHPKENAPGSACRRWPSLLSYSPTREVDAKNTNKKVIDRYNHNHDSSCKPIFVYNPELFDPANHLPPALRSQWDWARLLLDIIERRHLALDCIDSDFVCLHSKILENHLPKNVYYPVRSALVHEGVIEVNHSYAVGDHSKGFRLREPFASMRRAKVMIRNPSVAKKLTKNKAEFQVVLTCPEHERLFHWLNQVQLANQSASAFLNGLSLEGRQRTRRELDLLRLVDRDFYFVSDISGRVHNNIVNLASEFRQFLSINDSSLVCLDIANSQPLFLSIYLLNDLYSCSPLSSLFCLHNVPEKLRDRVYSHLMESRHGLPQDVQDYVKLTGQGRLYDYLMEKMGVKYKNRQVFKRRFFEQVFYCKPSEYKAQMREAFKSLFPNVQKAIEDLKAQDYKNAPLTLQRREAQFIIHGVCRRMFEESPEAPVLTIHDSLLTTADWMCQVEEIMNEEFLRLGVRPTLTVKGYGRPHKAPRRLLGQAGRPVGHFNDVDAL